jgi:RNA recognition motif. (a.k.a. RRM, RBD, or RNP domain)
MSLAFTTRPSLKSSSAHACCQSFVFATAVSKVHEQERGPKLTPGFRDDDLLRHRGPINEQPSGDTAATVAALWGHSAPSPPLQGLSSHSGFSDSMSLGILGGGSGSRGSSISGRDSGRSVLHAPPQKRTGGGIQVGDHTGFLRMRGLPFSAAKEDIYRFFTGFNPMLDSIVLTYRNDGRATGEAYIGFATPEDAERAMALHRQGMGSRYIELFISNKEEQGRALARFANR